MQQPAAGRITTCCFEAMFGYAEAAAAMWWGAANESIDTCGRIVKAAVPVDPDAKPKSWFNPNAHLQNAYVPQVAPQVAAGLTAVMPWLGMFQQTPAARPSPDLMNPANWFAGWPLNGALNGPMSGPLNGPMNGPTNLFGSPLPMVSPFEVWLDMFPVRGGPAAWPMAFFMLSAGIPKAVAWPTAAANAAMMEAAEVATGQMHGAYASYRSDGGHASAANANAWFPMTPTMAAYAS